MLAKKKADHRLPGQKSPLQPNKRTISLDSRQAVIIIHPSSHIFGVQPTGPKVLQGANSNDPEITPIFAEMVCISKLFKPSDFQVK